MTAACDYEALQQGRLISRCLTPAQVLTFIAEERGKRYDPVIADAFATLLGAPAIKKTYATDVALTLAQAKAGMVLARDVVTKDGIMLLSKDHVLDATVIEQIQKYELSEDVRFTLCVKKPQTLMPSMGTGGSYAKTRS